MLKCIDRIQGRRPRTARMCAVTLLLGAVALHAGQDTWPQFRGPNRDGKAAGRGLLKEWPDDGPDELWAYGELGFGFGSASVTEHAIYVTGMEGDEGFVYALDLDGKLSWKASYGRDWDRGHRGSRTTPTVYEGRVYAISAYGQVVCYDAVTGRRVWAVDTMQEFGARNISWGITESPLVVDGMVIVSPGGDNAGVVALDPASGRTIWVCADVNDRSGYCSPIVVNRGGRTIIAQLMASTFVGIDAGSGKLLWREVRNPSPSHGIQAVSPVYQNGKFYVTSGYGGQRGQMFELSADGAAVTRGWHDSELDCHHGGLVLLDGHIYGAADRNNRNQWLCMELETGTVAAMIAGVGKGSVVYADGMLYTYGERGEMGLVKPDPADFRLVSSFRVSRGDGPHWAHPSIAGGRLYIRHGAYLIAHDIQVR